MRLAEAKRVKESGASAQVSIDGDENYHDRVRGSVGAFTTFAQLAEVVREQGRAVVVDRDGASIQMEHVNIR